MMNKLKKSSNLLMCIAEIIVGVLLLVNPVGFTKGIIIVVGVLLTLQGIAGIIGYFRAEPAIAAADNMLSKGLLLTCLGCFCMFCSDWFISAFPVLSMFYGVLILISAFEKLQWTADMRRMNKQYWYVALISAVVSLVFAILILTNLFAATNAVWIFVGISLIIGAALDIVTMIFQRR